MAVKFVKQMVGLKVPMLVFLSLARSSKMHVECEVNKLSEHIREFVNKLGAQIGTY